MLEFIKKLFTKKPKLKEMALQRRPLMETPGIASNQQVALRVEGTPMEQAPILAADPNVDVRLALVSRIVTLLPNLSPDEHSQIYAYAVKALQMLAQDEVTLVRRALSSTLKDYAKAPPSVVARLARDVEREISEPILRFCIALDDDEMLQILGAHPDPWVISAIAGRSSVSAQITKAVFETNDVPGTSVLISNPGAEFLPATLEAIVEAARHQPDWHRPLALRKDLTVDLARQLTGFVSDAILQVLKDRSDYDSATRSAIVSLVTRRMEYASPAVGKGMAPEEKLHRYVESGTLTPDVIADALAWQEKEFVILALAYLANTMPDVVRRILATHSAKPIVALSWRAHLPPRLSLDLQRLGGGVQPRDLLYPKGGTEYPLTAAEIAWQLEFFGMRP